jgi:hypothetical protein
MVEQELTKLLYIKNAHCSHGFEAQEYAIASKHYLNQRVICHKHFQPRF